MAETGACTTGIAPQYNNCHGIKNTNSCSVGTKTAKWMRFDTTKDSYTCFKEIWSKWYKVFPTQELAHKWSGGSKVWLGTVKKIYYN